MTVLDITLGQLAEHFGILITISGGLGLIWQPIKKVLARYDDTLQKLDKQLTHHARLLEEQERINSEQDECAGELAQALKPLNHGVQQILRFRLQRECERINRKGSITGKEYEDLYRLHDAYEALGQNGLITSVYREAIRQPRKD